MRNLIVFTAIFVSFAGVCFSDTIHVPSDYPTIQQALDAAQGLRVQVAPLGHAHPGCLQFVCQGMQHTDDQDPIDPAIQAGMYHGRRLVSAVSYSSVRKDQYAAGAKRRCQVPI